MAQIVKPYDLPEYDREKYDNYDEYHEEEKKEMEKLFEEQPDSLGEGLEGIIITFHVADGYAYYRVVSESPLKIQHIPYLDGYKIPQAHIRGLRKKDIRNKFNPNDKL